MSVTNNTTKLLININKYLNVPCSIFLFVVLNFLFCNYANKYFHLVCGLYSVLQQYEWLTRRNVFFVSVMTHYVWSGALKQAHCH